MAIENGELSIPPMVMLELAYLFAEFKSAQTEKLIIGNSRINTRRERADRLEVKLNQQQNIHFYKGPV